VHGEPTRREKRIGFTLVELLLVIAIISILTAIAIPALYASIQTGRLGAAETTLSSIRAAENVFFDSQSRFGDFSELTSLMVLLDSRFQGKGRGPVIISSVAYEFTVAPNEEGYEVTATIPGGEGAKVSQDGWIRRF